MNSYAGIGTQAYNPQAAIDMHMVAMHLYDRGFHLNSGGAPFSDTVHEQAFLAKGAIDFTRKSIFLPWDNFNGRKHDVANGYYSLDHYNETYLNKAYEIAAEHHPSWHNLNPPVRRLMARNALQVLGANLQTPVDFVVAYTQDGSDSGGTGQAIRMARALGIPVYNLYNKEHTDHLLSF